MNTIVASDPRREKKLLELLQWEHQSNCAMHCILSCAMQVSTLLLIEECEYKDLKNVTSLRLLKISIFITYMFIDINRRAPLEFICLLV